MKRNILKIIGCILILFVILSCNVVSGITEKDIEVRVSDKARPNFITFHCLASEDKYDAIEWRLSSGDVISRLKMFTYHFPQKGEYCVKVILKKKNAKAELRKNIVIDIDDPYYANGRKMVWYDEFEGDTLNKSWWVNETDTHVNDEKQVYTPGNNINVADGILTITAKKRGEKQEYGDYTSGRLNTEGKKEFVYGLMEIRAKLPKGRGSWPAIWMLGNRLRTVDWPACGEIDIMEHVGFDPGAIHSSLHTTSSWGDTQNSGKTHIETFDTEFHIYGLNWTPEKLEFYVDSPENIYYTYNPLIKNKDTWPFDEPFFFILNLAIGGGWGGKEGIDDSIFPCSMLVDYIRVYQTK